MLMILARLVCSESFWAVVKVRSPHTGPGIRYIIKACQPSAEAGAGPVAERARADEFDAVNRVCGASRETFVT